MKLLKWIALAALAVGATIAPAQAKVDVVTANQDLAWLTQAIGGKNVSVDYLAGSNQDPHMIDPRPSLVAKLARADAIVRIGLDLDLWFDGLIRAAGNSKIVINKPGYIDASRGVRLLQVPQGKLDPSQGDIHIYGNPHYFYGPSQVDTVADTIRDGLKRIDAANGAAYDANYSAFVAKLNEAMKGWRAKMAPHRGKSVVTYHQSLIYFLTDFGLKEFANVEPKPGLEPTAGHVSRVSREMKADNVKVIVTESWRPKRFTELLARQSGARVVSIPGGIGGQKGINDYFSFIGAWVDQLSAAL